VDFVPVGIDPAQFEYLPDERRPDRPTVFLTGSMSWYPSFSAAERLITRLWPEIKRRVPEARLRIVGWGARRALAAHFGRPDVEIEENVPDMKPYFEQASVLVYTPQRGSGMKMKVMESLAQGVPVVTTSEGAEGLPVQDGVHLGLCDEDGGLVERAVHLLLDRPLQNRMRAAARRLLEEHCGPAPTLDGIERLYARVLADGRS
jgi:glycosyltransferase involved in cell wall biosynthesis